MISIGKETYFIDVDALDAELHNDTTLDAGYIEESRTTSQIDEKGKVISKSIEENKTHKPKEVDGFKYDFFMNMIRTVMEVQLENDDPGMPFDINNAPLNFTIAFNTLLYKKIIKSI